MYCPSCGQAIPDPYAGVRCPSCSAPLSAAAGAPPDAGALPAAEPVGTPWERRRERGFFKAILETLRSSLFEPTAFYETMPKREHLGSAVGYALLLGWLGMIGGMFWSIVFSGAETTLLQSLGLERPERALSAEVQRIIQVCVALFAPALILIFLFIWSGILHLCLLIVGGAREGFEATARVYSYAMGSTSLFQWVPICGGLIGLIWSLVLQIIGLSRAHGIGGGRAAAAVLMPLALCCVLGVVVVVMFAGAIAALAGRGGASW